MSDKYSFKANINKEFDVDVSIQITKELFDEVKNNVYNELKETVKLKGFRQGKGPKNLIEASLGGALFEKTLDKILPKVMTEIVEKEKYRPISRVEYQVKKMDDNGVEFNALFVNFPEFKLGKLSKIKVKKDKAAVTDEEIKKVVDNMLKDDATRNSKDVKDLKADDKWVTELKMDNITKLEQLEGEIRKTLENQKKIGVEDKYTNDIMTQAIDMSKITLSTKILDQEVASKEKEYKDRLENLGLKVDDFLKTQKTSIEDMQKDWRKEAEQKIAGEFLLVKIAEEQKFDIDWSKVDEEINTISDVELKKQYSTPEGKIRISEIMLRQEALKWLVDQVK